MTFKHILIIPLFIFTGLLFTREGLAQTAHKSITHQKGVWLRYYGQYAFSPDWRLDLEVEDRRFGLPDRQLNWVLPRVAIRRKLGAGWGVSAGFTYYLTSTPQDPDKSVGLTVPELRPHQEFTYQQKAGRLGIKHRYKLEERFKRKTSGDELAAGYDFNFRARYQLQLQYPLIKKEDATGALNLRVWDEVLLNFGHNIVRNTFDQNRIYLGLNYGVSRNVQLELGYLKIFQQRSDGDHYYSRDNIRFTLYHTVRFFNAKK